MLSTHNCCQDYLVQTLRQATKFILCYNRLYFVIAANSDKLEYTLELLNSNQTFLSFYTSQLKCYVLNDNNLFLQHTLTRLGLVDREVEVYKVLQIVDRRHQGQGQQYLMEQEEQSEQGQEQKSESELQRTALKVLQAWLTLHPHRSAIFLEEGGV